MELSGLLSNVAPVTATYLGHDFNMKVWTEKLTPTYKAELVTLIYAEDASQRKDENAHMLAQLVKEWDVVLEGEPFPPTYENFMQLSYPCLNTLLRAIQEFLGDIANPQSARG